MDDVRFFAICDADYFLGLTATVQSLRGKPKPWQPQARRQLRRTAYLVCLRELLIAPGALTASMQAQAPVWLRPGALNAAAMHALCAANSIRRGHAHARKAGSRLKQRARALAGAVN